MTYLHEMIATDSLSPNPWNSNRLTPDAETKLDTSIQRFGFVKPIIVRQLEDGTRQILGGEHRWHSAQRMGMAEVPVVNLGLISDEKAKEIGLIDNARYGMDDAALLADILKSLGDNDDLASFLPYSTRELEAIYATAKVDVEDLTVDDSDEVRIDDDLPELSATHQLMRFKVPVGDAEWISNTLSHVMKTQGFTESDSLTNAGDALVFALKLALDKTDKSETNSGSDISRASVPSSTDSEDSDDLDLEDLGFDEDDEWEDEEGRA